MIPKELDDTDRKIINELKKNSRISMTELGKKVFMTGQAAKTGWSVSRIWGWWNGIL